jgi:GPI-anchor transamidase subunit S
MKLNILLGVIKPTLQLLSPLHNFTIESQVQYYAPLAFEPPRRGGIGESPYYGLGEDQLKIFVNSAEWSLCKYQTSLQYELTD